MRLLAASSIKVPTQADWEALAADVAKYGMYNQNLQAVPPTGSIVHQQLDVVDPPDRVQRGSPQRKKARSVASTRRP